MKPGKIVKIDGDDYELVPHFDVKRTGQVLKSVLVGYYIKPVEKATEEPKTPTIEDVEQA